MKNTLPKTLFLVISFLLIPVSVLAIGSPVIEGHTMAANGTTATLQIRTERGAKITVVGGPSDLAPVTEGSGKDKPDGYLEMAVGISPKGKNDFSVTAQSGASISGSVVYTIDLTPPPPAPTVKSPSAPTVSLSKSPTVRGGTVTTTPTDSLKGDRTPPAPPIVDDYPSVYEKNTIEFTGSVEALANIYVRNPDGRVVGSTQANEMGVFKVKVDLEVGKTNRLNMSGEDSAGNEGPSNQIVIRVVAPEPEKTAEENNKAAVSAVTPFADIQGHWGQTYIEFLYKEGIVSGKDKTHFDPDGIVTRAELVKMTVNAFNDYLIHEADTPFTDVRSGDWFYSVIRIAYRYRLIQGVNNQFFPNNEMSRAEALKVIIGGSGIRSYRELESPAPSATFGFTDVSRIAWYYEYIAYALDNKIISQASDGKFRPVDSITRAEVAKILYTTIKIRETKDHETLYH